MDLIRDSPGDVKATSSDFQSRMAFAVVMPLYNERGLVCRMIQRLPAWIDSIIVVDDASTDGSREEVRALEDPRVRLVCQPQRSGPGHALRRGFEFARSLQVDVVITMDADGQMSPDDVDAMVNPLRLGIANYVKGCRFQPSVDRADMPLVRKLVTRVFSRCVAILVGDPKLRDASCGFTAATGDLLARIDLEDLHGGYGVYADLLERVLEAEPSRVAYVPVRAHYGDERSHFQLSRELGPWLGMMGRLGRRATRRRLERARRNRGPSKHGRPTTALTSEGE